MWSEEQIRDLIMVVRSNPGLYAKSNKAYKDAEAKKLAWEAIGASLNQPVSGEEASKKFKNLRDTFVKELRKTKVYTPSGAGASSSQTTSSNWEFFTELIFLSDHVVGRKTISNMSSNSSTACASSSIGPAGDVLSAFCTPSADANKSTPRSLLSPTYQFTFAPIRKNTSSPIAIVNSPTCGNTSSPSISSYTPVDELDSSVISSLEMPLFSPPEVDRTETNPLTDTQSQTSSSTSNPPACQTIRGKAVAGFSKKRPRKDDDKEMIESSLQTLTESARAVAESLKAPAHTSSGGIDDEIISVLKLNLRFVPENKKWNFAMDIMSVGDAYKNGCKVTIIKEPQSE